MPFGRVVTAAALLTLCSCSKHRSGAATGDADTVWLETKAAHSLARVFRSVALDATEQGPTVLVAGKKVGVAVSVGAKAEKDGKHILAAEFEVSVDGKRVAPLAAGAIGVDDTAENVRNTVAAEWAAQYGAPIGFAVATQLGARGPPPSTSDMASFYAKLEIDGQALFHGPPGLRGNAKVTSEVSDDFVRRIATAVIPILRRTPPAGEYRSSLIQVVIEGTALTEGECRIDGVVSADLLAAVSKLPWPEASPSYMFKLFFVGPAIRSSGG